MTSYRDNPDAIRALVQDDRVHRDLYTSQELFELEQEHFFANTWNYVGHESQLPKPGDWISNEIAGRPLIVARHSDGSVRAMMNRCAHKGSRLVNGLAATPASSSAAPTTPGPSRPTVRCWPFRSRPATRTPRCTSANRPRA